MLTKSNDASFSRPTSGTQNRGGFTRNYWPTRNYQFVYFTLCSTPIWTPTQTFQDPQSSMTSFGMKKEKVVAASRQGQPCQKKYSKRCVTLNQERSLKGFRRQMRFGVLARALVFESSWKWHMFIFLSDAFLLNSAHFS